MSSCVITATPRARSTRADSSVWRIVESPKITGTSSLATVDRKRLFSSCSMTTTSYPSATRSLTTRMPVEPRPTTTMWSRIRRARRIPAVWTKRRDSSRSATSATRIAVMVTPREHQPDSKYRSTSGLLRETEIAEADAGDYLGGEVQGIEPRHPRVQEGETQHGCRAEHEHQREYQRGKKQRVGVLTHGAHGIDDASHPGLARARRCRGRHGDPAGFHLVFGADHRGPVAGVDLQVPSRTRHHLAGGGRILAMDHRHRRQVVIDVRAASRPSAPRIPRQRIRFRPWRTGARYGTEPPRRRTAPRGRRRSRSRRGR